MREKKNILSRQSSFCYEHSYIYSNMYPSKMNTLQGLNIVVQILCANRVGKNQEAMA